jgi:hypothetical protein
MLTAVIRRARTLGHSDEPGCHLALIKAMEFPNHKLLINRKLVGFSELRNSQFAKFATTDFGEREPHLSDWAAGSESSASIGPWRGELQKAPPHLGPKTLPNELTAVTRHTSKRDVYSSNASVTEDSDA